MTMANRSDARVLREVTEVNDRIRAATAKLDALHTKRRDLYLAARTADPPVPYKQLAAAAGTTEAAVMQVVNKGMDAVVGDAVVERVGAQSATVLRAITRKLVRAHPTLDAALAAARTTPPKDLLALAQ